MNTKTISADYLRHNLKEVVNQVLAGQPITLKYGQLGEIELVSKAVKKPTNKELLLKSIQKSVLAKKSKKPSYKNNRQLYNDLYNGLID